MFGSMFIGLSGMSAYSNALRQVSNNITNLNSTGYRGSSVSFSDINGSGAGGIYNSSENGSRGNGVAIDLQRIDFTEGEIRQSNNDLDLAVEGKGFLVLEKDGNYFYARTGSFEVDTDGFVVLSGTDYRLTVLNEIGEAESLSVNPYRTSAPQQSTRIIFSSNLSSTADTHTLADLEVFNALGETATWTAEFTKSEDGADGEWLVTVSDENGMEIGTQTLKFVNGLIDQTSAELEFSNAETGHSVIFDFSENVTSFSSGSISTLRSQDIDGYGIGDITSFLVNENGTLEIGYSNQETFELGAVALADFQNEQALEQRSGGIFEHNGRTGRDLFSSQSDRVGRVLSNRIEGSNVDLSAQFGDLILVQRGYQASSQIVSVSNDMIQQLFGIRGQG